MEKVPKQETTLIQQPLIAERRCNYLFKLKELPMEERKTSFYSMKKRIDSNLSLKKCWQTDEVKGVSADGKAGNRVIADHGGSEEGFVSGT